MFYLHSSSQSYGEGNKIRKTSRTCKVDLPEGQNQLGLFFILLQNPGTLLVLLQDIRFHIALDHHQSLAIWIIQGNYVCTKPCRVGHNIAIYSLYMCVYCFIWLIIFSLTKGVCATASLGIRCYLARKIL